MRIAARCLPLILAGATALAQPSISAVRNGASYSDLLAPGCWMVVAGSAFASAPATGTSLPLPKVLGGVSITVDGVQAPLLYVSATQINALIPFEVTSGDNRPVPVVVTTPQGTSKPYTAYLNRSAPALFTRDGSGTGPAHIFDANFRPVDIVSPGDVLLLYATGLGPTNPPASTDGAGSGTTVYRAVGNIEVFAGEQKAEVLFAGLAPGFPGVYQINIRVPGLWTNRLYLRLDNWLSNIAEVGLRPQNNASNVQVEIEPSYPSPGSRANSSLVFQGAHFRVSFDVSANAQPFVVAAVGETGGCFTRIDRASGRYETWCTSPTEAARAGDFSTVPVPVIDFVSGCTPFPGKIIPAARLDPVLGSSLLIYALPRPDEAFRGYPAGVVEYWGALPPGAAGFVSSATFADFLQLPCGSQKEHKTTFTVYVDGKAVGSKDATYPIAGR